MSFDKYELYSKAVQSAEVDVVFLKKAYKDFRKKDPVLFREDFCGTFALSCEWVKMGPKFKAIGLDLDEEPLKYGQEHYCSQLSTSQQSRLQIKKHNVLEAGMPKSDLVAAMNFSYFIFKKRETLKKYFQNVLQSLNSDGVFVIDLFGGSLCQSPNEEKTVHKKFTYYWEQSTFNPITNEALYYIHFRLRGQKKLEKVFTYDWRMWSLPELQDLLLEVGFKKTNVYWEGTTRSGGGDGKFTVTDQGEACQAWVAYISAAK